MSTVATYAGSLAIPSAVAWGVAVCAWLTLPEDYLATAATGAACCDRGEHTWGLLSTAFARKWDGSCAGWSPRECVPHLVGDLLTYWAYTVISYATWTHHPVVDNNLRYRLTLFTVAAFIGSCAVDHLLNAYTVFVPIYRLRGAWIAVTGVLGWCAALAIPLGLIQARDRIRTYVARKDALERSHG